MATANGAAKAIAFAELDNIPSSISVAEYWIAKQRVAEVEAEAKALRMKTRQPKPRQTLRSMIESDMYSAKAAYTFNPASGKYVRFRLDTNVIIGEDGVRKVNATHTVLGQKTITAKTLSTWYVEDTI